VKSFALLLLTAIVIGIQIPSLGHALTLPRPVISEEREFRTGRPEEIVELQAKSASWRAVAFKYALNSCDLTSTEVQTLLDEALATAPFKALNAVLGPATSALATMRIVIAIDSFAEGRLQFASFHLPNFPEPGSFYIGLDCHPISRNYWKHSLAHELTHVLNTRLKITSWADEMAAQLVEDASGGNLPLQSVGRLASAARIPYLFDTGQPFVNSSTYGLVYLFGSYLTSIGGRELVQAFLGYRTHPKCVQTDFYEAAVCRAHAYLTSRDGRWDFAEKMTPKGLLRHFAIALTLNHRAERDYYIPFWSGLLGTKPDLTDAIDATLAPGEFQRFAVKGFNLAAIPLSYEVYLVRRGIKGFEIITREELEKGPLPEAREPSDEFFLVLNLEKQSDSKNSAPH
jgi:hypothetical protein